MRRTIAALLLAALCLTACTPAQPPTSADGHTPPVVTVFKAPT